MRQRKQSQKTIFTWFSNLPTSLELQGFHYFLGKKKKSKMQLYNFFLSKEQHQNPNLQASAPWIKSQKISH